MSSTGPKSLAGLTRARHRGNVAPSKPFTRERPDPAPGPKNRTGSAGTFQFADPKCVKAVTPP